VMMVVAPRCVAGTFNQLRSWWWTRRQARRKKAESE
jgi:hypothetical protein